MCPPSASVYMCACDRMCTATDEWQIEPDLLNKINCNSLTCVSFINKCESDLKCHTCAKSDVFMPVI